MGYWEVLVNPKDRKCLASLCTVIYIAWLAYLSKAITLRSFPLFTAFWVPQLKAIWKLVVFLQTMCYSLLGRCQQVFNSCWTSCSKYLLFIIEQIVYTMELVYEYIQILLIMLYQYFIILSFDFNQIFDATNTTFERRALIMDFCTKRGFKVTNMPLKLGHSSEAYTASITQDRFFQCDHW